MKNNGVLDGKKVKLYMHENADWMKIVEEQSVKIPEMKKMLSKIEFPAEPDVKNIQWKLHFQQQLNLQEKEMQNLNNAIKEQQKRLDADKCINDVYDIDTFCSQDILSERIKAVEKMYIDLKCNFTNYLATLL